MMRTIWPLTGHKLVLALGFALFASPAHPAAPPPLPPVLPVVGHIPARGLSADHEGSIAFYTDAPGAEPVHTAHLVPWDVCNPIGRAYYYLASRDYAGIDPQSAGGIRGQNPVVGFPRLTAALAANGFTVDRLRARYTVMNLGADVEGQDWGYTAATKTETRRYRGGEFQWLLDGHPLIGGPMPDFIMVIQYALNGVPCNDRISGYTETVRPADQSQASPPAVQAVAAAFLQDVGAGEIRYVYDSFQPATQWEYNGGSRHGAFFDAQVGRLELIQRPTLSIDDVRVVERDAAGADALFTVSLSQAAPVDVQVDFTVTDGTAVAGSDYSAHPGTLTIPAGQLGGTLRVTIWGDRDLEPDETFFVNLANPVNAVLADAQGQGTILNDDQAPPRLPELTIADVSLDEGHAGTVDAVFTVSLSEASAQEVRVDFATADGTAQAGTDYDATLGTLIVPAQQLSGTVRVPVRGDRDLEPDETFFVDLIRPVNAIILDGQGRGTIRNDDVEALLPALSVGDVRILEGHAGLTQAVFTVSLWPPAAQDVRVQFASANGTAVAGLDFANSAGNLLFLPGHTNTTLVVNVKGDLEVEPDETFFVNLSNPIGAVLADPQGQGTIVDDDLEVPVPILTIEDVSVSEGDAGTANAEFAVSLSAASPVEVRVDYATADGTAEAGSDYTARQGTLAIPPGATRASLVVPVLGDLLEEPGEEYFYVNLTNAVGATLARAQAEGTIVSDERPPFDDGLPLPPERPCLCTPLIMNRDHTGLENWFVRCDGGDLNLRVIAATVNDHDPEHLRARVFDAAGTLLATVDVTYTAAEAALHPFEAHGDVFLPGRVAGEILRIEITTPPPTPATQPHYRLKLCGAIEAGLNSPSFRGFEDLPAKWVFHVRPAEALTVDVFTAGMPTPASHLVLTLVDPSGALALPPTPTPIVAGAEINLAAALPGAWTLVVLDGDGHYRLDKVTGADRGIYVDWRSGGRAIKRGTIFHDGRLAEGLPFEARMIPVVGQAELDWDEAPHGQDGPAAGDHPSGDVHPAKRWSQVTTNGLFEFTNLAAGDYRVQVTPLVPGIATPPPQRDRFFCDEIRTNRFDTENARGELRIEDARLSEGHAGQVALVFTLSLSAPLAAPVTVDFATADGTAAAGTDYTAASGTVLFPPGTTRQTVSVQVHGDRTIEPDETLVVTLLNPVGATLARAQGQGTILDDDGLPALVRRLEFRGNEGFTLELADAVDAVLEVQASTDLERWTLLGTLDTRTGQRRFVDAEARALGLRFYRLVPQNP